MNSKDGGPCKISFEAYLHRIGVTDWRKTQIKACLYLVSITKFAADPSIKLDCAAKHLTSEKKILRVCSWQIADDMGAKVRKDCKVMSRDTWR